MAELRIKKVKTTYRLYLISGNRELFVDDHVSEHELNQKRIAMIQKRTLSQINL